VITDLRSELAEAYADVSLTDPVEQVVRRGRRIRRARRARRVAPALVAAAAVVVAVTVSHGGDPAAPGRVELVGQQSQVFPLSFDAVPAGLTGPSLSLDPSFEEVAPGRAHAGWSDPDDPDSGVGLQVEAAEPSADGDDEIGEARIDDADATVYRTPFAGADPYLSVVWERADDQWVTVTGDGRFATEDAVVGLARQVVDRPVAVPLQLSLAPRGWVLVAYKDDRIVTLADPAGDPATDATARTLNAYLPQPPSDPADLPREVGATGGTVPVTVHAQPAYLLPTQDGWFVQAAMADGTVFVVQAPADFTVGQVVEVAEGVSRP
jgi:hypothetical protein